MKRKDLQQVIENERGAMLVEFALIIPLYVICLLFMMFIYEFVADIQSTSEAVRYEFRDNVDKNSSGRFTKNNVAKTAQAVPVSGLSPLIDGTKTATVSLKGYMGCYHGLRKSFYRRKYLQRTINY